MTVPTEPRGGPVDRLVDVQEQVTGPVHADLAQRVSEGRSAATSAEGDYVYTVDDLAGAKHFDDVIAFCAYKWHLPDPKRPSYQPLHNDERRRTADHEATPYRMLVPRPVHHIICPGRAICVERHVLGPLREQGHATGWNVPRLRRELEAGAVIEWGGRNR